MCRSWLALAAARTRPLRTPLSPRGLAVLAILFATGCGSEPTPVDASMATPDASLDDGAVPDVDLLSAERLWQSSDTSCIYTSPLLVRSQGQDAVFVIGVEGEVRLIAANDGEDLWAMQLAPTAPADRIGVLATPAIIADRYAVFGYSEIVSSPWNVLAFYVAVLDLETRGLSPEFERVHIQASRPAHATDEQVVFEPLRAVNRGAMRHVEVPDRELGLVYASYGNGPSVQPFHGWVFELDLDAWRDGGGESAISGVLLTTAENDCGPPGNNATMVCGGGVWNAAGPTVDHRPDGSYEIFVSTGNGRVDFDVGAYAHSVMRVRRGLVFERECDATLCAPFDEIDPARDCLESCRNVFVPRLEEGEPPLIDGEGRCEGKTFLECYGELDADLGANAAVVFEVPAGPRVVVQAGKDGALYLVDAEHLGRMYQRLQIMDICGTLDDPCEASWLGMFVTHPVVAEVDGDPVVILSGQMGDNTHPAGITAVRVAMDGDEPRMTVHWQVPDFESDEALRVFRNQSGRPTLAIIEGETYVLVVETRRALFSRVTGIDPPGQLWAVRVRDGHLGLRADLTDAGQRYSIPYVAGDHVYVTSCEGRGERDGRVEAYRLSVSRP